MSALPTDDLIQLRITRQLYQQSAPGIFANILNTLIVAFVFRNLVPPRVNLAWAGTCLAFLLFRLAFTQTLLRQELTLENHRRRLAQFGLTVCLSGLLFGSAGLLYLSADRPAYNAFIFFLMGGVFAGALGALAIERRVFAAYAAPVFLPVTAHCFVLGGEINTAMAAMGLLFMVMMGLLVQHMNRTMISAFRLEIQNAQLAQDTQRLNDELLLANEQFRRLSFHDSLTDATNRRFISDILQHEVARFATTRRKHLVSAAIEQAPDEILYGIFVIDIDHFKEVNDTWGHGCGDQLLIQFVDLLKGMVRKEDVVTRWGGEEFVVVLKRTTSGYLHAFARKVIETVAGTAFPIGENASLKKTCSLGYAEFPFSRTEPEALSLEQTIEVADRALYLAKAGGRNQAVCAASTGAARLLTGSATDFMQRLSEAIDQGRIRLERTH
jgi:diguanylate cyclase (GGDEF)-like protein